MAINTIDAVTVKKLFLSGAAMLESKKEWINDLNVFPVPDGDTGTNMTLTIMSAVKEVEALEEVNMETLCKAISSGSLRGARGNSGVILSQLLRGFTKIVRDQESLNAEILSQAFDKAVETAYKAVMKPKEGTILTVARGMADKIMELSGEEQELEALANKVIIYGDEVLDHTPDLLPVLKQAGVVDSGGQGLMQFMKGVYAALCGNPVSFADEKGNEEGSAAGAAKAAEPEVIEFGYCTEYIIKLEKEFGSNDELHFKAFLESIGNSIVVVSDGEIVKVHVHTNHPGQAFEEGLKYGQLTNMKVDNMREEHEERVHASEAQAEPAVEEKIENKKYGFISVSAGSGLSEIFKNLGVDCIIEGGQTMNPSTQDMLNAIDQVHADAIYILPNNSNIILAAQQAQKIVEDKTIYVVPTKTIPQGISAMIAFMEDAEGEANLEAMTEAIASVKSGSVTYAVRDTEVDDKVIKVNDIMGIGDKKILSVGQDITEVTKDLISQLADEDSELISIYYGADITEEQANALATSLEEEYPDIDIEVNEGNQPVYYYLLSVE